MQEAQMIEGDVKLVAADDVYVPVQNSEENNPSGAIGARTRRRPIIRSERGEGVISTAIAVLIVAFLGIALWTGFDGMMNSATEKTRAQVEQIGG
ncbi:MAG TPA: hypothetical protein VL068_07740 [Microthrixaceae bacterium]|nr:hypothetical protein [Microthrixaceae bacterium]